MKPLRNKNLENAVRIIRVLRKATAGMVKPAGTRIIECYGRDPFLILVSCLLSLRTKDAVSFPASQRLFALAKTPQEILSLPISTIEKAIYPVGFYRRKAQQLRTMSQQLLSLFHGQVPCTMDELLSLDGVGRKTANLVLADAFDIPAICVDTHVHRLANLFGLVNTKTPQETEFALKRLLPKKYWKEISYLLVTYGQNTKSSKQLLDAKKLFYL